MMNIVIVLSRLNYDAFDTLLLVKIVANEQKLKDDDDDENYDEN